MSGLDNKYIAFISYSHKDEKVAKWLQRKLESYKLPVEVRGDYGQSKYLRPVFRDRSDLGAGVLSEELQESLRQSRYLIVICSSHSMLSEWVNREVQTYLEWGRVADIIPFVVDGQMNGDANEFLPQCLKMYTKEHLDKELLSVNIFENGREEAFIRVVSHVLGLGFDQLWKRYVRDRWKRLGRLSVMTSVAVLLAVWFALPVTLSISVVDCSHDRIPSVKNGVLKIGEVSYDRINTDTTIVYSLPGFFRMMRLPVIFDAVFCQKIDTLIDVGVKMRQNISLSLVRDDTFACFAGKVVDEDFNPVAEACVQTDDGIMSVTDSDGKFLIDIPIDMQTESKAVIISRDGYEEYCREDEIPGKDITYVLRKIQ